MPRLYPHLKNDGECPDGTRVMRNDDEIGFALKRLSGTEGDVEEKHEDARVDVTLVTADQTCLHGLMHVT